VYPWRLPAAASNAAHTISKEFPMSRTQPAPSNGVTDAPVPVISVKPIVLPAPERGDDLQVRVSAPVTGDHLPVIVFSHGFGKSMDDYAPLIDVWAAHGFLVVQPTHLDSKRLGVAPGDPRTPLIWRSRINDLERVLDELDLIEASVPGLAGRLDRGQIAAAGHSWGATTASALLGARILDPDGNAGEDMSDPRVSAGVLLALAGTGGENLTPFAAENFSFMNPHFAEMAIPALIVAGDHDQSPLSTRGPDWWTDAYTLSPGEKGLLTLFNAEHSMGGISGYSATETTDEDPARVAFVQQASTAYLRTALEIDEANWPTWLHATAQDTDPAGQLQSK
jgi:pimeloyl-ACP methyl ester carboxylesterase